MLIRSTRQRHYAGCPLYDPRRPLIVPRRRLLLPRVSPRLLDLVRGPGGGLLSTGVTGLGKPQLAGSTNCCCDEVCCPTAPAALFLTFIQGGTPHCCDVEAANPFQIDQEAGSLSGVTFCEDAITWWYGTTEFDCGGSPKSFDYWLCCSPSNQWFHSYSLCDTVQQSSGTDLTTCDPFLIDQTLTIQESGCCEGDDGGFTFTVTE